MVATFNPTLIANVVQRGIVMPYWSKTFQTFRSHYSFLAIEKLPKNLNFQNSFTSNGPFGRYIEWNACTDIQNTCRWASYRDAKLIKNISSFLLHSSVFAIEKHPKNLSFQRYFNPYETLWWLLSIQRS